MTRGESQKGPFRGKQSSPLSSGLSIDSTVLVERLYTPWRREFIESAAGDAPRACFLCDHAQHPENDRVNLVLARRESVFVLLNLYPYNSGHLMVAPFAHTGDLAGLDPAVASELMHVTQSSVLALRRAYSPEAFNIGLNLGKPAGAGVPDHLHVHVVPRWNGDTNFMPVLGETKVLPESLMQTYDRLEPLFRT
jgi:ATP adenylyltransferase